MAAIIIGIISIIIGIVSFGGAIVYLIYSGNHLSSKEANQAETEG